MQLRQTLTALFLTICLPMYSFGQTQKSEQQLKNYLRHLKNSKVDTLLIIKSGCAGCEVKYADTSKAVSDGHTIYIFSQQMGQFKIISFDDFGRQHTYIVDTCSLFDTIKQYQTALQKKDLFYKKINAELKKKQFFPPRPKHYSYKHLTVKISKFTYEYNLIENDTANFEFPEEKEKWFTVTKKIIDDFFTLLESVSHS